MLEWFLKHRDAIGTQVVSRVAASIICGGFVLLATAFWQLSQGPPGPFIKFILWLMMVAFFVGATVAAMQIWAGRRLVQVELPPGSKVQKGAARLAAPVGHVERSESLSVAERRILCELHRHGDNSVAMLNELSSMDGLRVLTIGGEHMGSDLDGTIREPLAAFQSLERARLIERTVDQGGDENWRLTHLGRDVARNACPPPPVRITDTERAGQDPSGAGGEAQASGSLPGNSNQNVLRSERNASMRSGDVADDEELEAVENLVFIGMPIGTPESQERFRAIQAVCKGLGLELVRADEPTGSTAIGDDIRALIDDAEFLIFDISEERQNVYHEIGYAEANGHPLEDTLLVATAGTKIHFNISQRRVRFFSSIAELRSIVRKQLTQMIEAHDEAC